MLALFFAVFLCIPSFISAAIMFTFALSVFLQVLAGATSSFRTTCFHVECVILVMQTFVDVYFVRFTLLHLVVGFSGDFWLVS